MTQQLRFAQRQKVAEDWIWPVVNACPRFAGSASAAVAVVAVEERKALVSQQLRKRRTKKTMKRNCYRRSLAQQLRSDAAVLLLCLCLHCLALGSLVEPRANARVQRLSQQPQKKTRKKRRRTKNQLENRRGQAETAVRRPNRGVEPRARPCGRRERRFVPSAGECTGSPSSSR